MRNRTPRRRAKVWLAVTLFAPAVAPAATYTWTSSGSGDWSNPANWSGGIVPVSDPSTNVVFSGTTSFSAHNDLPSPFLLNQLRFSTSAPFVNIDGAPLTFVKTLTGAAPQIPLNTVLNTVIIGNDIKIDTQLNVNSPVFFGGTISGSGGLSVSTDLFFDSPQAFSGGVTLNSGTLLVSGAGNTGTGPIVAGPQAKFLAFDSAANIASGDHSLTTQFNTAVNFKQLDAAALNRFTSQSHGVLALSGNSNQTVDLSSIPLMTLGTYFASSQSTAVYSGIITPGGNTYRFGGVASADGTDFETADLLVVSSLLTDAPGGAARSVSIQGGGADDSHGGKVQLTNVNNSYSGGTIVRPTTSLSFNFRPAAGQTPLGSGDLTVEGELRFEGSDGAFGAMPNNVVFRPGSLLYFRNPSTIAGTTYDNVDRWPDTKPVALNNSEMRLFSAGTAAIEAVGPLTFTGTSTMTVDWQGPGSGGPPNSATLRAASIARNGNGLLLLKAASFTQFAVSEKFSVADTTGLLDGKGIVQPYILGVNTSNGVPNYLTVGTGGVLFPVTPTPFSSSTDNEIATGTFFAINETAWHVVVNQGTPLVNPTGRLTLRGGGMLLSDRLDLFSVEFSNNGTPVPGYIYCQPSCSFETALRGSSDVNFLGGQVMYRGDTQQFTGKINILDGSFEMWYGLLSTDRVELGRGAVLKVFSATLSSITGEGTISDLISANTSPSSFTFRVATSSEFKGGFLDAASVPLSISKTGPGELILSGGGSSTGPNFDLHGSFNVLEGTLTITGHQRPAALSPILQNFNTSAGAHLNFNSDFAILNLDGAGETQIAPGVHLTATHVRQNRLALATGALLAINPSGQNASTSRVSILDIPGTADNWQAAFDLSDNALIVDGGNFDTIVNQIRSGVASGKGIISSRGLANHVLGAIVNTNGAGPIYTTFGGISGLDGDEVLVRYTIPGDLDLNGSVAISDFIDLAAHFGTPSGATWQMGDTNGDGAVTIADFINLAATFGQTTSGEAIPLSSQDQAMLEQFAASAIPEPAALFGILAGTLLLPARPRLRRFAF